MYSNYSGGVIDYHKIIYVCFEKFTLINYLD